MKQPFVRYEQQGRVATLTFQRPGTRNSFADLEDCVEVIAALERANGDPGVSVLIVTGEGSAFSMGGNLESIRAREGIGPVPGAVPTRANYKKGVQKMSLAFAELEIATIAAMNGHAAGVGLDIACLCDLRVVSEKAKLAASFIRVGMVPGDGGAWILPKIVGYTNAAEMILTGDFYTAAQVRQMGLVNAVVPPDQVLDEANRLAARIACHSPAAVRLSKRLLRESQHARLPELLELSAAFQALAHETADHREAVASILEKREPHYTGE